MKQQVARFLIVWVTSFGAPQSACAILPTPEDKEKIEPRVTYGGKTDADQWFEHQTILQQAIEEIRSVQPGLQGGRTGQRGLPSGTGSDSFDEEG